MIPEIFKIVDDQVVLNPTILLVPEYRTLWDYCNNLDWFSHLYFSHHPESPFANYSEEKRDEVMDTNYPNVDKFCFEYIVAKELFIEQCNTPCREIYIAAKIAAEQLLTFYKTSTVTDGRDGNMGAYTNFILNSTKIMKAMAATENAYKEELISARGGEEITNDENVDYNDDNF